MSGEWKEVTVRLRYRESVLTHGGISRDEPETIEELVEEIDRAMNASHFGGRIELAIVGSTEEAKEEEEDTGDSRAMTAEEMRHKFLSQCGAYVHHWGQVPSDYHRREFKLPDIPGGMESVVGAYMKHAAEGTFHSIMVTLDGGSMECPAMNLTPCPHPSDKAYHIGEEENWWEPIPINDDCQLHELLNKYRW
jgi:hypothetical protein